MTVTYNHVTDSSIFTTFKFYLQYNPVYETVVSADTMGMVEYWTGPKYDYKFPKKVTWEYKTDTDLYEFVKVSLFLLTIH